MGDEADRHRLALVVVEALEIGTHKREWDIADDLFAAFALDLGGLEHAAAIPATDPKRDAKLRRLLADQLSAAAPSTAALLNELLRYASHFLAMVEEIYARLTRHAATTTGTGTETFTLRRGEVEPNGLELSEAFLSKVRHLERQALVMALSRIDVRGLDDLVLADNGELYGSWPLTNWSEGFPLADAVLHLPWVGMACLSQFPGELAAAQSSAARLVAAAESLLAQQMRQLDLMAANESLVPLLRPEESPQAWRDDEPWNKHLRFADRGYLATSVHPGYVTEVLDVAELGVDRDLKPVLVARTDYSGDDDLGGLAGFVAMFRTRRYALRKRPELEEKFEDPAVLRTWLEDLTRAADEAATWLENDVRTPVGTTHVEGLVEVIEEFLNLPLWKQRSLLYEVWVLCATLDATERAGWESALTGLERAGRSWSLDLTRSPTPVAKLQRRDLDIQLDVWREPLRPQQNGQHPLTPDLVVSTAGELSRDLLVVEAKDRHALKAGTGAPAKQGKPGKDAGATEMGLRYARLLRPNATWVVNHCDYPDRLEPVTEQGDVWDPGPGSRRVPPRPGAAAVRLLGRVRLDSALAACSRVPGGAAAADRPGRRHREHVPQAPLGAPGASAGAGGRRDGTEGRGLRRPRYPPALPDPAARALH